jgi:hypothetical protein
MWVEIHDLFHIQGVRISGILKTLAGICRSEALLCIGCLILLFELEIKKVIHDQLLLNKDTLICPRAMD